MTVEAISKGEDEDSDQDSDRDNAYDQEEEGGDWHEEEDDDEGDAEEDYTTSLSPRRGKRGGSSAGWGGVARRDSTINSNRKPQRRTKRRISRHGVRTKPRPPSAAVVYMRHQASGTLFVWRTAGVKDTGGGELHEGDAYRLVASVKEPPDVVAREIAVTRCRLSLVTDVRR